MKDDRLHLVQPRYVDGKHDGQLARLPSFLWLVSESYFYVYYVKVVMAL